MTVDGLPVTLILVLTRNSKRNQNRTGTVYWISFLARCHTGVVAFFIQLSLWLLPLVSASTSNPLWLQSSPPPLPVRVLLPIPVPMPFDHAVSLAGQHGDAAGQPQKVTAQISSFCFITTRFFAIFKTLILYPKYLPPRKITECGPMWWVGSTWDPPLWRVTWNECPHPHVHEDSPWTWCSHLWYHRVYIYIHVHSLLHTPLVFVLTLTLHWQGWTVYSHSRDANVLSHSLDSL